MNPDSIPTTQRGEFVGLKEAARITGFKYHNIRAGVRSGMFATYAVAGSRKKVRISEVLAIIEASRAGDR